MHDVLYGFLKHVVCLTEFYQIYLTPTNLPPTTYSPTRQLTDPRTTTHRPADPMLTDQPSNILFKTLDNRKISILQNKNIAGKM